MPVNHCNTSFPGLTTRAAQSPLRDIGPQPQFADACELDLECPITVELFVDPVISRDDGHTYDKSALEAWVLKSAKPTSPLTRAPLTLAIAWKARPATAPEYFVPNNAMRVRVAAYREEAETFAARLASWEEARDQLAEDMALLTVLDTSRGEAAAAAAPSAPPFALLQASGRIPDHPWMQAEAAPFGRIDWPKSRHRQTANEYAKRGENAYRVGDLPDALRWLGKAVLRAPEDNTHLLRMVNILAKEGRNTEALMWLHFGVRLKPQDIERNYEFGQLLLAQASTLPNVNETDAGVFLQTALELMRPEHDPARPHSCMRLARLCAAVGDYHFRTGNTESARALFVEAEKNHPGHGAYVQRLGRSWLYKAARLGVTCTDSPELRQALQLLGRAREMLQSECADHRNRDGSGTRALAACSHAFGEAQQLQGNDQAAAAAYREAIALDRQEGMYHGALGDALRNLGDTAGARSCYFKAAGLNPRCGRYDFELSCIAYAEQRWDLAREAAREATRKDPQNALFASQWAGLRDVSGSTAL